jgi:hypothetical protein
VIKVINDANAKTHDHQGISEAMNELENMLQSSQNINDSDSACLDDKAPDDDDIGVVTMMEQRSNARPNLVGRVTHNYSGHDVTRSNVERPKSAAKSQYHSSPS